VTVHGRYFPQTRMGMLCKFHSFVSPARWLSEWEVACVAPQAMGDNHGIMKVPVTISINGGADWAPTTAEFTFVPTLQGLISPSFGPQRGGTLIDVQVPRRFHEDEEALALNQVVSCCFGNPQSIVVPAERLSDTHYRCETPPWPHMPARVEVGVMQADGRCQPAPRAHFHYLDAWRVMRIYPEEVIDNDLGRAEVLISGESFRPYSGALCRFGGHGGPVSRAYVLEGDTSLRCIAAKGMVAGFSHEVEVAVNGVDFVGGVPRSSSSSPRASP